MPSATPYKNDKLYLIESILKGLLFPFSLFMNPLVTKLVVVIASLLAIIRNKGMVKFSKEYLILAVTSEFFHNIIYTVAMPHGRNSIVFYLPIYLQFFSGLCEFFSSQPILLPALQNNEYFKAAITFAKTNRNYIIIAKNRLEIYLFFYTIVGAFFGITSYINIFLMF